MKSKVLEGQSEEVRALVREAMLERYRLIGRRGGKKRAANQTAQERSELARHAARRRWEKLAS